MSRGVGVVRSLTCPCRSRKPLFARRRICFIASNLFRPVLCLRIAARPAFDLAFARARYCLTPACSRLAPLAPALQSRLLARPVPPPRAALTPSK